MAMISLKPTQNTNDSQIITEKTWWSDEIWFSLAHSHCFFLIFPKQCGRGRGRGGRFVGGMPAHDESDAKSFSLVKLCQKQQAQHQNSNAIANKMKTRKSWMWQHLFYFYPWVLVFGGDGGKKNQPYFLVWLCRIFRLAFEHHVGHE